MENVKAKRLNSKSRLDLAKRLEKDETIELLFNDNKSSWVSGKSFSRANADCMLLVSTLLDFVRTNNLEDSIILDFSKRRENLIVGKDD